MLPLSVTRKKCCVYADYMSLDFCEFCRCVIYEQVGLILSGFVCVLEDFTETKSPAVLIKMFQALQEERVLTYKLFDEFVYFCLHIFQLV